MWNLVMNLPGTVGNFEQPFIQPAAAERRELANGQPYTAAETALLFDGRAPHEAARMYSAELKNLIRRCLAYRQAERPSFQRLRQSIAQHRAQWPETRARGRLVMCAAAQGENFVIGATYRHPAPARQTVSTRSTRGKRRRSGVS
jgi:hypothetical protein